MYSPKIVERSQQRLEEATGLTLARLSEQECWTWCEHLSKLWDPNEEVWKRSLRVEERDFIQNERLLCAIDYRHWLRYAQIMYDPDVSGRTGMGPFVPTDAQELVLGKIAKMEEEQTEAYERGEPVTGILLACHKSRQLGYTMLFRTLLIHRVTTTKGTRAITASINEEKVLPLSERDNRLLDNLPPFLRPSRGFSEKGKHIKFDLLDTLLMYQELVQRSGIAQGDQWDIGHLTEVASVPGLDFEIQHQYEPTIPRSPSSLHGLETTPQGRNNWWRFFVEDIRKGYSRWSLSATPWYAELRKYRAQPPAGWTPSKQALLHAQQVYETSLEYVGKRVILPPENLYWWEFTRADYQRKGNLAAFYTNYWAVIEESFQHVEQSAFDPETLERLRGFTSVPSAYEIRVGEANV